MLCSEQILYIAGDSCQLWVCSPFMPILAPVGPLLQASLFLNSWNRGLLTKKLVPKKTFFFWQNFSTMRNSLSDPRDLKDEHKSSTASWLLSAFRTWRLKKVVLGIHWRLLATDVLSSRARHQKMAWVSTRVGCGQLGTDQFDGQVYTYSKLEVLESPNHFAFKICGYY